MSRLSIHMDSPRPEQPLILNSNSELFLHLLRATTAQIVVVGHAMSLFGVLPSIQPPHFFCIQDLAVVIFFFLSGYVISYTCQLKSSKKDYGYDEFLFDRAVRLYVVLIPSLVFIAACDLFFWKGLGTRFQYEDDFTLKNFVASLFYFQHFPPGKILKLSVLGSGRSLWTLAIEWWFYVAFGWLTLSHSNSTLRRWGGHLLAAVSVPMVIYRLVGDREQGFALLWSLGVGAMLVMQGRRLPQWNARLLYPAGCGIFVLTFMSPVETMSGYHFRVSVCLCLAVAILVLAHQSTKWQFYERLRMAPAIRFFADYSFTLYLVHYTVLYWMKEHWGLNEPNMSIVAGSIALSNIIAVSLAAVTEFRYRSVRAWLLPYFFDLATIAPAPVVPGVLDEHQEPRRISA